MLGDLFGDLLGQALFGRLERSERIKNWLRFLFGLLGAGLGAVGAWHFATAVQAGLPLRLMMIALMLAWASFWLFNVALLRRWAWPWKAFVASFVGLFVVRIVFGA